MWLALWAQNRRRRRLRLMPSLLPAPVLRSEFPDKLAWDWPYANPYKWNVWQRLDGGATFFLSDGYWMYGDARRFAPDGAGQLHYIVGIDASGNEITEHSNAVRPDEALPPIDLLLDLFAYWKLDENEGNDRLDSSGNGYDLSEWDRFGGDGTIGQTGGLIADAALFNDGTEVGLIHNSLATWDSTSDFTVAGWFHYAPNNYDTQYLATVGTNLQIAVRPYEGAVFFSLATNDAAGNFRLQTADESIIEGPWIHFAAVKSGRVLRIYLNGVLASQNGMAGGVVPVNETLPHLCVGYAPFGYPFNGAIDELSIWKRALYADEIATLYNNGDGLTYEQF